jgi:hypothetical protein
VGHTSCNAANETHGKIVTDRKRGLKLMVSATYPGFLCQALTYQGIRLFFV